jgi:hypothetical protein
MRMTNQKSLDKHSIIDHVFLLVVGCVYDCIDGISELTSGKRIVRLLAYGIWAVVITPIADNDERNNERNYRNHVNHMMREQEGA